MSEKSRLVLTAVAMVMGFALAGCAGEGLVGPAGFDEGAEISELTVVPRPDSDDAEELQIPGRGGSQSGGGGNGFQDEDHR